ncbi:MAG TPA: exodeoxyribonuclease VII large subunit [Candidatus Acidoferrales bacterium]|nr:exodeoxyribonuclease VII large subunit [Candidatus Acidoferrales bacterium]
MQLPLGLSVNTPIWTVSQLNRVIRDTLDAEIDDVWVAGEISTLRVPASGHFYFALKDKRCEIAAVMFRSANQLLPFRPAEGMEVIVRGRISIYEARGNLQLYVEAMEPRGVGSLQLALEQLKQRLAAEGLFELERKRPLPFMPATVGIVTALGGAAIHDMLVVLRQRMPQVNILLRPVRVQGREAPPDIVQAFRDLGERSDVEVIIVGRGGGSVEDLWAFNDERVARAIAACRVPVVSAVGHEIDVTIADLVADCRAPTPTAAAALVVPNRLELQAAVETLARQLQAGVLRRIDQQRQTLNARARHLRDPRLALKTLRLRIDELAERAQRAVLANGRAARQSLRRCSERLNALSPLAVLDRGYSIARRLDDRSVVRDPAQTQHEDLLELLLARGTLRVRVDRQSE